jgi:acyl carrier protein
MSGLSERYQAAATTLRSVEQILERAKGSPQPRPEQEAAFVAPTTETEQKVAALWAELLAVDAVGVHDDFYALGGHSLLVTEILSRLHDMFGVEIPLIAAFTDTFTVSELARRVELLRAAAL